MVSLGHQYRIVSHGSSTLREAAKLAVVEPRSDADRPATDARPAGIEQLASREVYRSPWLRVREDEIGYADGTVGTYAVVEKQDFVTVLPYTGDGFWLVEQYRYPVGVRAWEFPQGGWPAGAGGTLAQLAAAELAEETGLRAGSWQRLGNLYAAYGYCTQSFDVWLATDLSEGEVDREHTEQDMVHRWFSEADLRSMMRNGEFPDSHSVAALALFDSARAAG
jgi:8-oxo-dGTP pyrophosphatase MutT (NUDIX family)